MKEKIGFIGQGFIGKNLADNFEGRGFPIVRYSKDKEHADNKEKIKECRIVFVAVPTPTLPSGFDNSILREVLGLCEDGTIVVIKSTMLPLTARSLQEEFFKLNIVACPEFLDESTAKNDTDHPVANIIGISNLEDERKTAMATKIISILPKSPVNKIMSYEDASMVKYIHNVYFYIKNVFFNMSYDMIETMGGDWEVVREGVLADHRITPIHTAPIHKGGRGCGGHCHIKDFAAFRRVYNKVMENDRSGRKFLSGCERRNILTLKKAKKDLDLLEGVYGEEELDNIN